MDVFLCPVYKFFVYFVVCSAQAPTDANYVHLLLSTRATVSKSIMFGSENVVGNREIRLRALTLHVLVGEVWTQDPLCVRVCILCWFNNLERHTDEYTHTPSTHTHPAHTTHTHTHPGSRSPTRRASPSRWGTPWCSWRAHGCLYHRPSVTWDAVLHTAAPFHGGPGAGACRVWMRLAEASEVFCAIFFWIDFALVKIQ